MPIKVKVREKLHNQDVQVDKIGISDFYKKVEHYNQEPSLYEYVTAQEYPLFQNKPVDVISDGVFVFDGKLKDREYMVSFSGGKDSTAMLIRLLELNEPVDRIIFADTQYELPIVYEYIDKIERYIQDNFDKNLKVEKVTTTKKLEDMVMGTITRGANKGQQRGFPLTAFPCYWSREAKIRPLDKVMQGHYRYIGIASDEQERVSKNKDESLFIYPLIDWGWTEKDCMDYLESKELTNPIYNENVNRTGCFWCPKQQKASMFNVYTQYPEQWQQMKEMEKKAGRRIRYRETIADLEVEFNKKLKDKQQ